MTAEDVREGSWNHAVVDPRDPRWVCPECRVATPVVDWREGWVYCEGCGEHEGRTCPNCDETADYVEDSSKLKPPVVDISA